MGENNYEKDKSYNFEGCTGCVVETKEDIANNNTACKCKADCKEGFEHYGGGEEGKRWCEKPERRNSKPAFIPPPYCMPEFDPRCDDEAYQNPGPQYKVTDCTNGKTCHFQC